MRGTVLVCMTLAAACAGADRPQRARRAACDVNGSWAGTAVDPAGAEWQLTMVFHQSDQAVAGTAEWNAASGTTRTVEELRGVVTCADGVVKLHSVAPIDAAADYQATTYTLELAADDASITGRFGPDAAHPGTLTARRK